MTTVLGIVFILLGIALSFFRPQRIYLWGGKWRSIISGPILIIIGILLLTGVIG